MYRKRYIGLLLILLCCTNSIFCIDNSELYLELGNCIYDLENEQPGACQQLQKIMDDTNDPLAMLYYGHALMLQGEKKQGKNLIFKAVLKDLNIMNDDVFKKNYNYLKEDLVKHLYFLGLMSIKNNRSEDALNFWDKAMVIAPTEKWANKIMEQYLNYGKDEDEEHEEEIIKDKKPKIKKYQGKNLSLNIFSKDKNGIMKISVFSKRTQKVTMIIFNMGGTKISQILKNEPLGKFKIKMVTWNGTDDNGNKVKSGSYVLGIVVEHNKRKSIEESIVFEY